MKGNGKAPVLVVLQLSGGNDFMNTVVPYTNGDYHDARPLVRVKEEEALPIDDTLAFHPSAAPLKDLYDQGKVGVVQGVGYPNSSRSHFRAMDIMHTCEPVALGTEGWVGRAIRELDPKKENVLTGVNLGRGLPRAMSVTGVPVTSVGNLDSYGLLTGISEERQREEALDIFKSMYSPAIGTGPVMEYLAQTGMGRADGRGPAQGGAGDVRVQRRVRGERHRGEPARRGEGAHGGPGDAHLLRAARRLRYARQRDAGPPGAALQPVGSDHGLYAGPSGARRLRRGGDNGLHRVRETDEGQRARGRTTAPGAAPSSSATGSRAACTQSTLPWHRSSG